MSGAATDQALIHTLTDLGAPSGGTTALWAAGESEALAAAIQSTLGVRRVRALDVNAAESSGALKLVVSRGMLDRARLRDVAKLLGQVRGQLAEGGVLALEVRTAFAPVGSEERSLDHALFPQMAAQGQLGGEVGALTPLTASGWLRLLDQSGFEVVGVEGYGARPPSAAVTSLHAERLNLFDPTELASGVIRVVARRREEQA